MSEQKSTCISNDIVTPMTKTASYGTWESPITAEMIAAGSFTIMNMIMDGDATYWSEMRPANKGRYTIVKKDASGAKDVTPPDFNARTFVHEYGGGAFTVDNGIVYSSNGADHAIYMIKPGSDPVRLTSGQTKIENASGGVSLSGTRFADLRPVPGGLVAVGEHHEPGKPVENFLALIDMTSGKYKRLVEGYDFYAAPALSHDNKKIAWICWNHPEMPWTSTELWVAEFNGRELVNAQCVTGLDGPEAIAQPQWSDNGTLYFISDRHSGWWNIHRYINEIIENVCPMDAEVGEPHWIFDRSSYAFLNNKIFLAYNKEGIFKLAIFDLKTKKCEPIHRDTVTVQHIRRGNGCIQYLEGHYTSGESIVQIEDKPDYPSKIIWTVETKLDQGYISIPQHIGYPSSGRTAYGFFYPPKNKDYQAPPNEKPPLVVTIHGGPTSQARGSYQLRTQFWTSRGFAVLDVNYGGSTGYGRKYRQLLDRNWGIVDVEDCENGALYLAEKGLVDRNKLFIRGGSAGGYTTLAALAFRKSFKAGASYFGVADITALAHDTHKFEQRYMEQLVGKYPEEEAIWKERSPINSVDKISSPLILFQGEDDMIVPKNQSIMIYDALKKRGIKTELHIYPGEEHGFRQAQNIIHSLNREVAFYLEAINKH